MLQPCLCLCKVGPQSPTLDARAVLCMLLVFSRLEQLRALHRNVIYTCIKCEWRSSVLANCIRLGLTHVDRTTPRFLVVELGLVW